MPSDLHLTLVDALMSAPSDKVFVQMFEAEDEITSVTFGAFTTLAIAQAREFSKYDLKPGHTVVLIMPQGVALMAAFAGAMLLGAVPAILAYPNFKVDPAKYRFGLSGVTRNLGARLVVTDEEFPSNLMGSIEGVESAHQVRHLSPQPDGGAAAFSNAPLDPQQVAFIQHSAGTTGLQKGVALSHRAVVRQLRHLANALQITPDDKIYSWLPLYHDMGLIACFIFPMTYHLTVSMQSPLDWVMRPESMLQIISRCRSTVAWMPNFAFQFMARRVPYGTRKQIDLSSIRMLINCSEPVRSASLSEFKEAFNCAGLRSTALHASYAMAENVFAVSQTGTVNHSEPLRIFAEGRAFREEHRIIVLDEPNQGAIVFVSSGRLLTGCDVRIVGTDGSELPELNVGEILIKSDSLFDGYYNRPDLTCEVLKQGWYWSGDLGFMFNGELFVVGRKKDLIIVAGKNIYPQDIEEIVQYHPAIQAGRAVAIGLSNSNLGTEEIVVVAEVRDERDMNAADAIEREIRTAIVSELDIAVRRVYLKPPRWIVKSTAGKPARSTTRDKLLREHPELNATAIDEATGTSDV